MKWADGADPLVLDLDGNGIEFTQLGSSNVYFDLDGDKFRERTAWLKGTDAFLAVDGNHNGRIDDVAEMFGGVGVSGFQELQGYDSNHDPRPDLRGRPRSRRRRRLPREALVRRTQLLTSANVRHTVQGRCDGNEAWARRSTTGAGENDSARQRPRWRDDRGGRCGGWAGALRLHARFCAAGMRWTQSHGSRRTHYRDDRAQGIDGN